MTKITTEMNMPIISAPVIGIAGTVTAQASPTSEISHDTEFSSISASIIVDPLEDSFCASNITVNPNGITTAQFGGNEEVAHFDIVFTVCINCGDGVSKTYQVVKRIGVDKCKIAQEASYSTPVSIVESKNTALQEEASATRTRFRKLAGLE
ncbi:MAG: hypothetical protein DDT31_00041 [Syntrophomonadaceae bacterium]|nr:hypothetical protein [Bacillota bacterium]